MKQSINQQKESCPDYHNLSRFTQNRLRLSRLTYNTPRMHKHTSRDMSGLRICLFIICNAGVHHLFLNKTCV